MQNLEKPEKTVRKPKGPENPDRPENLISLENTPSLCHTVMNPGVHRPGMSGLTMI